MKKLRITFSVLALILVAGSTAYAAGPCVPDPVTGCARYLLRNKHCVSATVGRSWGNRGDSGALQCPLPGDAAPDCWTADSASAACLPPGDCTPVYSGHHGGHSGHHGGGHCR